MHMTSSDLHPYQTERFIDLSKQRLDEGEHTQPILTQKLAFIEDDKNKRVNPFSHLTTEEYMFLLDQLIDIAKADGPYATIAGLALRTRMAYTENQGLFEPATTSKNNNCRSLKTSSLFIDFCKANHTITQTNDRNVVLSLNDIGKKMAKAITKPGSQPRLVYKLSDDTLIFSSFDNTTRSSNSATTITDEIQRISQKLLRLQRQKRAISPLVVTHYAFLYLTPSQKPSPFSQHSTIDEYISSAGNTIRNQQRMGGASRQNRNQHDQTRGTDAACNCLVM